MNPHTITIITTILLYASPNVFALSGGEAPKTGNGGYMLKPVDKAEQRKIDDAKRTKDAQMKTEQLNKVWKAKLKKAAKAKKAAKERQKQ